MSVSGQPSQSRLLLLIKTGNAEVPLLASSVRLSETEAAVATPAQDTVTKTYPTNRYGRVDTRSWTKESSLDVVDRYLHEQK